MVGPATADLSGDGAAPGAARCDAAAAPGAERPGTDPARAAASPREQLAMEREAQDLRHRAFAFRSELRLRERYAQWLLLVMVGQLVAANAIFVLYAWLGRDWRLEAVVVDAWLAATVIQVVGVVAVVTRHLFPARAGDPLDG